MAPPRRSTTETDTANESSQDASQSLLDFIINNKRYLTEREVRPLAQQLARTLSLIHAHGVVHRSAYSIISTPRSSHTEIPSKNTLPTTADLKIENIHARFQPAGIRSSSPSIPASLGRWRLRRRCPWQIILTNFTYAGVTAPFPATTTGSPAPMLVARTGEQYSPAPELLRVCAPPPCATDREPGVHVQHSQVPYVGPPVDVWGLGVVLFILVCGRVPFDGPTIDVLREAPHRSPESLSFPKRVSRDCRDLLRRMLHADPVARASLEEVLDHPWMKPASRRPDMLSVGADVPKHAALRWPDQVERQTFYRVAALESRNGDDVWKDLNDALGLVSRLCEAGSDPREHFPKLTCRSSPGRPFRGAREFPDRVRSLLTKIRSRAVLDWLPSLISRGPFEDTPKKISDNLGSKLRRRSQYLRPCRQIRCGRHHTEALGKSCLSALRQYSIRGWKSGKGP